MNYLDKIIATSKENGLELNISGSVKTKIFYNKVLSNPYKIISSVNSSKLFTQLCNKLVQANNCEYYNLIGGYRAIFKRDCFKFDIETNCNGFNTICVYKIN